ncbi:MAG: ABC transporter ATP-binding protein [Chloroflexi bacterium]|nr:ABC transporter ATP-binding protein [Chloroflexota bacterium]
MEAIRCQGLTKYYGSVAALDGLDLVVPQGTVFGFLGPNGAGKTTTLRLLTGLANPSAGKAWVMGQEVGTNALSLRSKIGYLPEEPAFYDWMTGQEFLSFVGELLHLPQKEIKLRCDELLKLVDLEEAARRKVGGYSRGMRQRLGIAQALMGRPQLLLLDEPCSALDPMGRRDILSVISVLGKEITMFMSTHILSDVERVCHAVAIISRGRLVIQSDIEGLRERYAHPVFEVEFDEDATAFAQRLRLLPWVARVETSSSNSHTTVLRIFAKEVRQAKIELPKAAMESGLALRRYELTLPTLEDIFIELTNAESGDL